MIQYISRLKLKATIDRNLLQARLLSSKLNAEAIFAQKVGGKHDQTISVRPQNIVRFYEKAIKAMKQQSANSEKDGLDPMAVLQSEMEEKYSEA